MAVDLPSIDLKSATADTTVAAGAFLFGADSQAATDPSVYPVANLPVSTAQQTALDLKSDAASLPFVNVKDYGATGDGATDDSAAFALAVATGRAVFVPAGTYKTAFDLASGQTLYGEGQLSILQPPAGATYVIRLDATTVVKQHCHIHSLKLNNPAAVASCVGLLFNGVDVNDVNDWHIIDGLLITGFDRGIEALGRLIWCSFRSVRVDGCGIGLHGSVTGASGGEFNQNSWLNCAFVDCTAEGIRITGHNVSNTFYTCNIERNNSVDTTGKAGVYVTNTEQMSFLGCYWESNGEGVAVDNTTLGNNSIGVHAAGTFCTNLLIQNSYITGSGILVWIEAAVLGGGIYNSRLIPLTGGYGLHCSPSYSGILEPRFTYDSSNYGAGIISILQDGNGNYPARATQATSTFWMSYEQEADLIQNSKWMVNPNGTTFTGVTAIKNRLPGLALTVYNEHATNTFTIDAGLIHRGSGVVAGQTSKHYIVGGYPANGKLVEV